MNDIMKNQPLINIGMIGHVANGKSTITKDISGKDTQQHSSEKQKNITIKLGYANAKIFKCPKCNRPQCYQSTDSSQNEHMCKICDEKCDFIVHVSFADCPGHNELMQVLLRGTCIMDYCILVESATNTSIPAFQTIEHFEIVQETGIPVPFICLNKIDLMLKNQSILNDIVSRMNSFVKNYDDKLNIPIVPMSGTMGYNIDVICEYIANLPIPEKKIDENFKMLIVRSFNINKERMAIEQLKGGVIGGSLTKGIVRVNDNVTIYPGYIKKINENNNEIWTYTPLNAKILSIQSEKNNLEYAISGGLIGIQLDIDSFFTGDDDLVGQVVYDEKEKNIKVYDTLKLKYKKLTKKLTEYITGSITGFEINSVIQINVNSNNIYAKIKSFDGEGIELLLEKPVCVDIGDIVSISKILERNVVNICGYGTVESGTECKICV
ncbi:eukaryotic translation initiation factor eIF-2 gamma [Bodo saltans virus]|uniref:protein-synthesizing GTPase n=1 Tax=Bodo saltans virus TaxID=2024608 RepID=A0A2H4UVR3_9VIRU|nr:eukaryotic translation initiation factor eIF-2 gamma [Bodo saltans virus]ATZ80956.1 eukaryotic translation initiation factor eIF-2 gamma [Bodo saltans virus]